MWFSSVFLLWFVFKLTFYDYDAENEGSIPAALMGTLYWATVTETDSERVSS